MAARPILPVQEMALLAQGQGQELMLGQVRQQVLVLVIGQEQVLGQVLVLGQEHVLGPEQVLGQEQELPASPEGSSDA